MNYKVLVSFIFIIVLTACGQKGSLVLPQESAKNQQVKASDKETDNSQGSGTENKNHD